MSDLEQLLDLQALDTRADQLRHRRAHLPERAEQRALLAQRAALDARAASLDAERSVLVTEQDRREAAIAELEARRASVERAMKTTIVPREAQALQADLSGLVSRRTTLEDEVLELMEQSEPLDATLAELAAERGVLTTGLDGLAEAIARAEGEVDSELAAVSAERAAAAAAVPPALLQRYDSLRAHLGGVAVARLNGNRCEGCHLTMAAADIEEIRRQPPDALVTCEQCGRLLVR